MQQDIRWKQRFTNYVNALNKLTEAVEYIQQHLVDKSETPTHSEIGDVLDEIVKDGLIQRFEYTHEQAWNVMKDYAAYLGNTDDGGSRDATREAFQLQLISNGDLWMDMIGSRNKTSHTYNQDTANEIYSKIMNEYYSAFVKFQKNMEAKRYGEQGNLL